MSRTGFGHIEYTGSVVEVGPNHVNVRLHSVDNCHNCSIKAGCNLHSKDDKVVRINTRKTYHPGAHVTIVLARKTGLMAITIGFVVPVAVMLTAFAIGRHFFISEGIMGVTCLFLFAIYYFILSFFKAELNHRMAFSIRSSHD